MKKVVKLGLVACLLLLFTQVSFAFKTTHSRHLADAPNIDKLVSKNEKELKEEAPPRKARGKKKVERRAERLARKQQRRQKRMQRFLQSRLGKWLIKRAIKKQERRQKRWERKYERKKKRWLAQGKDITKLKKKQRRGNIRTGILLIIIGALFFFALGTLSPFDIVGIVFAALGLLLILLYLLS